MARSRKVVDGDDDQVAMTAARILLEHLGKMVDRRTMRKELGDLQATVLHLLGLNHERLTYRHQGRDFRLTDVYGRVVHDVLA